MSKTYLKPVIVGEVDSETYLLENGNTQSKVSYDNIWNPPKGKIKPLRYKSPNESFTRKDKNRLI